MKKSRNFIISSLVALTGATLASSVTGTVAWFQYATSASIAYTGTTVGCSKLLQISDDAGAHWNTDLSYGQDTAIPFSPVSSGEATKSSALPQKLYLGPTYRKASYNEWGYGEANVDYQQFTLSIRLSDVSDGNVTPESANICLSDLTIKSGGETDIYDAVRVHLAVSGGSNYLFSKDGDTIDVCGELDLNNDGVVDKSGYAFENQTAIKYGGEGIRQGSYAANDNTVIGQTLGNTNGGTLDIVVTIWIEGWAALVKGVNANANNTAVWSNTQYNSNDFHVGMTFDVVE